MKIETTYLYNGKDRYRVNVSDAESIAKAKGWTFEPQEPKKTTRRQTNKPEPKPEIGE